jgi:hypothetical protein
MLQLNGYGPLRGPVQVAGVLGALRGRIPDPPPEPARGAIQGKNPKEK